MKKRFQKKLPKKGIKYWVPNKNPLHKIKRIWPFPLNKKRKKILIWVVGIFFFLIFASIAWISKDLPTPGKIKSRQPSEATQIFDREGNLLYAVHGEQKRILVKFEDIPEYVKQATVVTEDANFYKHHGLDFKGIARSAYNNIFNKSGTVQGGSTITQQYIKNALLSPERTWTRKIKEAILAIELEIMFSKDEILAMYLNEIPYGSNAYGIEAAAQTYFDKSAKDLKLAQAATLAALPRAPTYYSPYGNHSDELKWRKNYVLDRMVDFNHITEDRAKIAKKQKLVFQRRREQIIAPHFVMYTKEVLAAKYGDRMVEEGGLKVTTTLDPEKQRIASEVIEQNSYGIRSRYGAQNAALTAVDPKTGEILAMVGSVDYFDLENDGNVNVAIAQRSPGSSFKPIVYATGFKEQWSPASTLFDLKTDFGAGYSPNNYDGNTRGPVSIRSALANSMNIPAVKMLQLAGIENVQNTARDIGISTLNDPERYGLSLVLGGGEVELLEMTGAFGVFASGGQKFDVSPILKIIDSKGKVLEEKTENVSKQVLDPQIAYQINSILSDNSARAPVFGSGSSLYFPNRTVAAKTGTTQDYRDAWTVGYTPSLSAGIWVGNNDNSTMYGSAAGANVAAPLWHEFLEKALVDVGDEEFSRPDEIQDVTVDALTGLLPGNIAPLSLRTDILTSWQIPTQRADIYTTVQIDKSCGDKLASEHTPPQLIEEKTYANIHSELPDNPSWEGPVRAWAESAGMGSVAPTEICPIHNPENHPSITISFPSSGSTVSGSTTIQVKPKAPLGTSRVEYFVDRILIGTAYRSPFSHTYDMNRLSAGSHTLKAKIIDNGELTATDSITIIVQADSTPPGPVTGVSTSSGPCSGCVTLNWTNPTDDDFSHVNIYKNGSWHSQTTNQNVTISGLNSGQMYQFMIKPEDSSGNENSIATTYSERAQ